MNKKEQTSNELFVQTNSCCKSFLQNQISVLEAIRRVRGEFNKEEVTRQLDQILDYYKSKLAELPKYEASSAQGLLVTRK